MKRFLTVRNYRKLFVIFVICVFVFVLRLILGSGHKVSTQRELDSDELKCGRFPLEEDILVDNIIWQVLEMPRGFLKLLNAYLDDRKNKTTIVVNASGIKLNISLDTIYCQFWTSDGDQPYVVKASQYVFMWYWEIEETASYPYLISCPFDKKGVFPTSVSLTANPCHNAENNLKIIDNRPADGVKKKFGVCSKHITYENRNFGIKFIEWVHMLRILGNDKVYFYNRFVHPEFYKVLQYMEDQGLVQMWPYLEPRDHKHYIPQKKLNEMNMLNDCFYRIRNLYEIIIILDTDEVIMPVQEADRSWSDILSHFDTKKRDAFCSEMYYYPEVGASLLRDVPKHHYMLQHVRRSAKLSQKGYRVKSFLVPDEIVVVHLHYAFFCFNPSKKKNAKPVRQCRNWSMPLNTSHVNHYRNKVGKMFTKTVEDRVIWKFKDELIAAVAETLEATNFKP